MAKRRKRLLTWHANWNRPGGRWRKYIDGKVMYFGPGKSEDDARSYREAEQLYLDFLKQRVQTTPADVTITKATVADVCERFLQQEFARHHRGEISASQFEKIRCGIQQFADVIGPRKQFARVSELDLDDYRSYQLSQPDSLKTSKPISLTTAKARLDLVKALFVWGWEMRLCEMPRNLRRYSRLSLPRPSVRTFSVQEVQTLWNAADQRLRCFMALALNCGMGQKDISDLRMSEVDWDKGYIERERSKTGVWARYNLWSATLELMKATRSAQAHEDDDRVFLNGNGLPLVSRKFADGKLKVSDAVKNLFWRLQRRTGINDGRGFYCLRKSAATEIERIQAAVTEMFLAHAERGMKKHYAERNWAALDCVLEQLEQVYALAV